MKKNKILATMLSAFLLVSSMSMVACGGSGSSSGSGGGNKEPNYNKDGPGKLTIKVENFGLGPGTQWLKETANRFAKANLETQYGDKTGVYIKIEENHNQNTSSMANDTTNIFFDERASDPYALQQKGLLLNIDSIVKDETRVGGSLESKIFDAALGGIQGDDGSYYALPHYEFFPGIAYNRTTFEKLNAFFAADDETDVIPYSSKKFGSAKFVGDAKDNSIKKSVGPDGESGTEDDGLPRSLEEFLILCDFIEKESDEEISALTVSGKYYYYYPDYLLMGLWSSIAGAEQMRNYYNCTGEIEVVKRDASGKLLFTDEKLFVGDGSAEGGISYVKKPVTEMITMAADGSDGWRGNDMVAKYYAIAMLDIIAKEGFFSKSAKSEKDHWTTHLDLYMDGKVPDVNDSAMLVEGSYWYNESNEKGGFDRYEAYVGKNRNELDVAWMSLPTSVYTEGAVGRAAAFLDCGLAYAMINGNVAKNEALKQACLDFLAFCYSEEELINFTLKTGITRAISYNLNDEQKGKLSKYAARLWNERDSENGSNIIAWSGTTDIFKQAKTQIKLDLNCGVFSDGESKASTLLKGGNSHTVFSDCSLYKHWDYKF